MIILQVNIIQKRDKHIQKEKRNNLNYFKKNMKK